MSADVSSAVVQSVTSGLYPESEDVATAQLSSSVLPRLQQDIRQARNDVEDQVRQLSRDAALDVDGWIAQAKRVQADIEQSKVTAREIVQQAEAGRTLKEQATESTNKVGLLQKEVAFNESLERVLVTFHAISDRIGEAKEDLIHSRLQSAFEKTHDADTNLRSLPLFEGTRAYVTLTNRLRSTKGALTDSAISAAKGLVQVDVSGRRVKVSSSDENGNTLETISELLFSLDCHKTWLDQLRRDINQATIQPILDHQFLAVDTSADELSLTDGVQGDQLDVLEQLLSYFSKTLPPTVQQHLSQTMTQELLDQLESSYLQPHVPVDTDQMHDFEQLLGRVRKFANTVESLGWPVKATLDEWAESAPKVWLSRQREYVLGSARQLLLTVLNERKTVERVETQVITKEDVMMGGQETDDAWDTEWAEAKEAPETNAEDEDMSAWDEEEDEKPKPAPNNGNDDDAAWGWGEEQNSPVEVKKSNGIKVKEPREITLREVYTVTGVPDGMLDGAVKVFLDAKTLSDPAFAETPIAPAVSALYSLPTLALAMYRATATTSYSRLDSGNMLIYNDSTRLADQLLSLVDGKHEQSANLTLRQSTTQKIGSDVKALEAFARRAYSAEMESQRTILRDLLDGAQGFVNCTVSPFAGECDGAVAMTVDRIREVHKQWQSILSHSALLQSTGSLLATAISKIMLEISDLSDIGEDESKRLKAYCDQVSALHEIFLQSHPSGEGHGDTTGIYCPNWFRFQYLAEILESSLADIKYLWMEGELSLEFQREEVIDLIQALFADSDYRRRAVADIKRSDRG